MAKAGSTPNPKPTAPAPAANDPIEGAKIARKPVPEAVPPEAVDKVLAEQPTPAPVVPTPEQYVVTARTTISLQGQFITLNPDDIVSAASYGPEGLQRIKESNVPMRRIEDMKRAEKAEG